MRTGITDSFQGLQMVNYKVALISHEYPPFLIGGIGTQCYDLACSLSKHRIFTTVFCGVSKKIKIERVNPYLEVVRLPCIDFPPRFLWFQVQNLTTMLKMLKEFDVLHGVNPLASGIYSYYQKKLGKPFVTSIHEVYQTDLKVFASSPLTEWTVGDLKINALAYPAAELSVRGCLKTADRIVVCGRSTVQNMRQVYPNLDYERVSVIYNGVNLDEMDKISIDSSAARDPFIIYFGRLVWRKGIFHLMKAMSLLVEDFPDLSLKVIGRGPSEGKLRLLAKKFRLDANVQIEGHLPRAKLVEEIRKSSAVVLPSLYEVGPFISGLEAMACKKPLVSFDFSFTREFISNMQNGILAKPGDVQDLAAKIRYVISDIEIQRRLGENAYDYVKKNHNWNTLVEKYAEIYNNLVCK